MNELTEKTGLEYRAIEPEEFREFVRLHATSEEIGRIATYLDEAVSPVEGGPVVNLQGLVGCRLPCAVVCCLVSLSTDGKTAAVKLDSIVVDKQLRRQGLGAALVARSFLDLVSTNQPPINNLYAHSVHPATVSMLRSFGFSDPPLTGAPISAINLAENGEEFRKRCNERFQLVSNRLKLNCSYCRNNSRKARRWCNIGKD